VRRPHNTRILTHSFLLHVVLWGIQTNLQQTFRDQYEELKKRKDEAEENTIFRLQQKKGYAAEKKQVSYMNYNRIPLFILFLQDESHEFKLFSFSFFFCDRFESKKKRLRGSMRKRSN
jgi:hypothetical protein